MSRYLKRVRGWARFGAPTAASVMTALITALVATPARGADGVAPIMTNKSISAATVSVIDPETGSSSGGGTTDVNVGPGDIILFRMTVTAVPENSLHGIQTYIVDSRGHDSSVLTVMTQPPRSRGCEYHETGFCC